MNGEGSHDDTMEVAMELALLEHVLRGASRVISLALDPHRDTQHAELHTSGLIRDTPCLEGPIRDDPLGCRLEQQQPNRAPLINDAPIPIQIVLFKRGVVALVTGRPHRGR